MSQFASGSWLTPDLPGHGYSTKDRYDFRSLWDCIESHLSSSQWQETTLVLHSMAAALLPELLESCIRPAKLVLIEGNLLGIDAKWSQQICAQQENVFPAWISRLRSNAPMVLRSQLKMQHAVADVAHWAQGFTLVTTEALREIAANLVTRSQSGAIPQALSQLGRPTCYLRGCQSDTWEDGLKLLANLRVPVINIPNAAHYPMIDNPTATWDAILSSY